MIYIPNLSTNPYFNLALEEYVLTAFSKDEDYVLLWQNSPSIIVGAGQNTVEEINLEFVRQNKIHVIRRLSGGGAVYHDFGNLNFTFIVNRGRYRAFDFKVFTRPVIQAMHKIGVSSVFDSRNDLSINGRKFSGNAQYVKKNRLLHHGTLLVNSKLENLESALRISAAKINSKGIKSVRSRVTNISDYLDEPLPVAQFRDRLLSCLVDDNQSMQKYHLTPYDVFMVSRIMRDRYLRWDWNFGSFSEFNIRRIHRFEKGSVDISVGTFGGRIERCKLYGDFFGFGPIRELEQKLIGHRYDRSELKDVLGLIDINYYINGIGEDELLDLLAK